MNLRYPCLTRHILAAVHIHKVVVVFHMLHNLLPPDAHVVFRDHDGHDGHGVLPPSSHVLDAGTNTKEHE